MKTKRIMMAVAMMLVCISSTAQEKRLMEFQVMMAMHDTTYKNYIKDGKYKEAITPLTTLINILDTTTICQRTELSPEMIKAAKADYLYDQACRSARLRVPRYQYRMVRAVAEVALYRPHDGCLGDGRERHDAEYFRGARATCQRPTVGALRDCQLES